jgi:hypothetical protein
MLSNSTYQEIAKSSLLLTSLNGVRAVLEREFEIQDVLISTSEAIKDELIRRTEKLTGLKHMTFPYAYIELADLTAIKDQYPNKTVKRHGYRMSTFGATKATTKKAYIFPVTMSLSLKYVDNDPYRVVNMIEAMCVIGQIGGLRFFLQVGGEMEFVVNIDIPESTTLPIATAEDEHAPGAQEISMDLLMHTYIGFFRDVSAVNSDAPSVSFSFEQTTEEPLSSIMTL